MASWCAAFGRGDLEIFAIRDDGDLVAVLPMARTGACWRSPTNDHTPSFGPIVAAARYTQPLIEAILDRRPRRLDLSFLDRGQVADSIGRIAAAARTRHSAEVIARAPYVTTDQGWAAFEQSVGTKRLRELRRHERRLGEQGHVQLQVHDGAEQLAELLDEGFRVEASGWKSENRTAINSSPATRAFYTAVARWAADRGWLRLAFLRLDGHPVAFDFAVEVDGIHYLLKTGYASAARTHAPGVVLRYKMLQRGFDMELAVYDFLGTVEGTNNAWKLSWTGLVHDRVRLRAFAPTVSGSLDRAAVRAAGLVANGQRVARDDVSPETRRRMHRRWWRAQRLLQGRPPGGTGDRC